MIPKLKIAVATFLATCGKFGLRFISTSGHSDPLSLSFVNKCSHTVSGGGRLIFHSNMQRTHGHGVLSWSISFSLSLSLSLYILTQFLYHV